VDDEVTGTLVDADVLLDILTEDQQRFEWSAEALERAADHGLLVINPVIYAEVSVRFTAVEELDAALQSRVCVCSPATPPPIGLISRRSLSTLPVDRLRSRGGGPVDFRFS